MDMIFLIAVAFFLLAELYNLHQARKKKEIYSPALLILFMALSFLLMYFNPLAGFICFFLSFLFLTSKWKELKQYKEKRLLDGFTGVDYSEKIGVKDILTGNKVWGKMALKYGSGKAALAYSMYISLAIFLILYLMHILAYPVKPDMSFIIIFSTTYLVASYYTMQRNFRKFLAMQAEKTGKMELR